MVVTKHPFLYDGINYNNYQIITSRPQAHRATTNHCNMYAATVLVLGVYEMFSSNKNDK